MHKKDFNISENTLFFINYNFDYNLFFNTKHGNWEHFIAPVKIFILGFLVTHWQKDRYFCLLVKASCCVIRGIKEAAIE